MPSAAGAIASSFPRALKPSRPYPGLVTSRGPPLASSSLLTYPSAQQEAAAESRAAAGVPRPAARTLHGAWLVLRANQLWAPYPDNDPKRAVACMRRFYTLLALTYGEPASPARAAELEVDWWRVHREGQHGEEHGAIDDAEPRQELVASLTRLYCYIYDEPEAALRPAAVHRARAMDLSDQWIREGCQPDSGLLPLEHAALVRSYAALLAAVHR
jgi:hypothetical protein